MKIKKLIILLGILIGTTSFANLAQANETCGFKPISKNKYNVICSIKLDATATYSEHDIEEIKQDAEAKLMFASANYAIKNRQIWFLVKGIKLKHTDNIKSHTSNITSNAILKIGSGKIPRNAQKAEVFIKSAN